MLKSPAAARLSPEEPSLRPITLSTDLRQISDLLELVFHEERRGGPGAPHPPGMGALGPLAPLVGLLAPFLPGVGGVIKGFVWTEAGRIVGNVNLNRSTWDRDTWIIGNVAVHPTHRRRGIGRELTEAALQLARQKQAKRVILDVRDDNEKAYGMYTGLDFQHRGGSRELYASSRRLREAGPVVRDSTRIDTRIEGREAWDLVVRTRDPDWRAVQGLRPSGYTAGFGGRLGRRLFAYLFGQVMASFGVRRSGVLVAWGGIRPHPGRLAHQIRVVTDPAFRGDVEQVLVDGLIRRLGRAVGLDVWVTLELAEAPAATALAGYGFEPVETLRRLSLDLR